MTGKAVSVGAPGAWAAIMLDPLRAHYFDAHRGRHVLALCRNVASDARLLQPITSRRVCPECLERRASALLAREFCA